MGWHPTFPKRPIPLPSPNPEARAMGVGCTNCLFEILRPSFYSLRSSSFITILICIIIVLLSLHQTFRFWCFHRPNANVCPRRVSLSNAKCVLASALKPTIFNRLQLPLTVMPLLVSLLKCDFSPDNTIGWSGSFTCTNHTTYRHNSPSTFIHVLIENRFGPSIEP